MTKSVKGKLVTFTSGLIIFMMLLTSAVIYFQLSDGIEESVTENATSTVKDVDRFIQSYLQKYHITVAMLADDQRSIDYLQGDQDESLWRSLSQSHQSFMEMENGVQLMYIGTEEGDLISTPEISLPDDFDPRDRPWYEDASEGEGEVIWTAPYIDVDTNDLVITVGKSITSDNGQMLGVKAIDVALNDMVSLLEQTEIGYNGELALIDTNGIVIAHTDTSQVGIDVNEDSLLAQAYQSEQDHNSFNDGNQTIFFGEVDEYGWKVASIYDNNELYAELVTTRNTFIIVSVITIVLAIAASYFVASRMTKPIRLLNDKVKQMSEGDFSTEVTVKGKDEISQLASSVNHMSTELRQLIGSIQNSANDCKGMAEELSAVSEETMATSDDMSLAVSEVAVGASKQAEDIEEANQQVHRLSEQVETAASQTNDMNTLSSEMRAANEQGIKQMEVLDERTKESREVSSKVDNAIQKLTRKVSDIGTIVNTISEFADQTNLLALNASIEAARAGEHGKGFAVVADEVRKLAEQSMNATEQIRGTLSEVEKESEHVVSSMEKANEMSEDQQKAVHDTHQSFTSIVSYIENLTDSLEKLSVDLNGINEQKAHIVQSISSIAEVAEGAAATSEEVSASAAEQTKAIETVGKTAEQLNDLSTGLQEKTNRFQV
ncbi:methyl-accepting chemotaxis protein [Evansella halocellulosilytica]|uniref:methyl-accepting chemotaxis protein n=1 Tax=Evansella halocellulosilytica TaxID=2011013 RepID=UPI000BB852D0|nr:methyl-accepting chemotaxis protein [Evansella halocellulosilytica]